MLTLAELEDIRADAFAEDVDIPAHATSWTREEALEYFENGGKSAPSSPAPNVAVAVPAPAASSTGHRPTLPAPPIGWRLSAPMCFEVVHTYVRVRQSPALNAREVGMLKKGSTITVDILEEGWVQIDMDDPCGYGGGWMLTDGASLNLGVLLQPHVIALSKGTSWRVTCIPAEGGTRGLRAFDALPPQREAAGRVCAEWRVGSQIEVVAECGLWARVQRGDELVWVEMDAFFAG